MCPSPLKRRHPRNPVMVGAQVFGNTADYEGKRGLIMLSGLNVALIGGVAVLLVLYVLRRRTRLTTTTPSSSPTGDAVASE